MRLIARTASVLMIGFGLAGLSGCEQKSGTGTGTGTGAAAPAGNATKAPSETASSGGTKAPGGSEAPKTDSAAAAPAAEGSADDIVIGHYASITGSEATFGISTDQGIQMAVAERNKAGGVKGRQIRLITHDNQGKPQETQTVVTRLIEGDKVVAVLGEVASSRSLAGAPICQRKGIPMITPSSTNEDVTAVGDMISRVCFIDPFQGLVGAKFCAETMKFKKGAALYNRAQAYSSGLKTVFVDSFKKLGGEVVAEEAFSDGDNDFSAQLTAIRVKNPEFIYVPGYYTEVVNIARQARKLGITCPLVGGDGWDSEELKNAGDALNNCYFSNHYSHEDTRPEVQEFVKKYQDQYKKVPDGLAALGYDAARLLFDAMERSPSLGGKDLAGAINSTKNFAGVTGNITIDANRNPTKDAVILEIVNGALKYKATIKP
ncbi:MAG: ABC transporter substrate-binding protein [Phycisphaerales bacterium]|nr:ABC transporter substrate-binding protein [Phycisphaerales bacterium]